jgi:hypothetical protein
MTMPAILWTKTAKTASSADSQKPAQPMANPQTAAKKKQSHSFLEILRIAMAGLPA